MYEARALDRPQSSCFSSDPFCIDSLLNMRINEASNRDKKCSANPHPEISV